MNMRPIPRADLAADGGAYLRLLSSAADWFARDLGDVDQLRESKQTALSSLKDANYTEFKASLEFKKKGLAHASYKSLKALTISEIVGIFERFGLSGPYLLDTADKYCASPGTCSPYNDYVCTSSC